MVGSFIARWRRIIERRTDVNSGVLCLYTIGHFHLRFRPLPPFSTSSTGEPLGNLCLNFPVSTFRDLPATIGHAGTTEGVATMRWVDVHIQRESFFAVSDFVCA